MKRVVRAGSEERNEKGRMEGRIKGCGDRGMGTWGERCVKRKEKKKKKRKRKKTKSGKSEGKDM